MVEVLSGAYRRNSRNADDYWNDYMAYCGGDKVKLITDLSEECLLEQLIEECGELVQAAAKRLRILRGQSPTPVTLEDNMEDLTEEIADVSLCIDAYKGKAVCEKNVCLIYLQKAKRWTDRLNVCDGNENQEVR